MSVPTAADPSPGGRLVNGTFLLVAAAALAYFVAVGVLMPTLPRFVRDGLGGSDVAVGAMVTAYGVAAIASRPMLTWWAGRFGCRSMMVVGSAAAAAGIALHPLAQHLVPLAVLRMGMGVSEAMLFVGAATIVNDLAPTTRRAEAASYFSVAVFGGLGVGPLLGDVLARTGRFTAAFLAAAAFTAVAVAVSLRVPGRHAHTPEPPPAGARRRLFHPGGVRTGVVLATGLMGYMAWNTFVPLRADELDSRVGELFLVYSFFVLVLRVVGAKVPERVGLGRSAAAALVLIAVGLGLTAVLPGVGGLWVGMFVLAFGIALLYPSLMAITVNAVPAEERAAVVSTFTMFFEVGSAAGGLVLGAVAGATSYQGAFGGGALIALAGLGLLRQLVLVPRRRLALAAGRASP